MDTVVLANQKGGVGKSALAALLAHHTAHVGLRVLAIDFDHQGNLSKPLRKSGRPVVAGLTSDALLTGREQAIPDAPFVCVPSSWALADLERQPTLHTPFARNFRAFLTVMGPRFDLCVIDTNPSPDIRVISALASATHVLAPIQLNMEALDGVHGLLNHDRVGLRKIKAVLNPRLNFIGLLPTLVEPTPFQKANFVQVVRQYRSMMIQVGSVDGEYAYMPKRSAIAEAQASGEVLWEMKKTAARDAWKEIEPTISKIASIITGREIAHGAAA